MQTANKALAYFCRVANQTDNLLVRAAASEREFICEAVRISYTPHAPTSKGLAPPKIRVGGPSNTLGVVRTLSRVVKDAARVETPVLRVFGPSYRYLSKYSMLVSEARLAPPNAAMSPPHTS